jgi:L-ribulokinase
MALDWFNGRRSPDASALAHGALKGLTLGSDAPVLFRALVEATAFGARATLERFELEGVAIKDVIALGGVAKKSPFVMQVLSDVLGRSVGVVRSEQTCALGGAMCAAVAAGVYDSISSAQDAMGSGIEKEYHPVVENAEAYNELYAEYCRFGEAAG